MLNKQTKGIQINKTAIVACFPLLTSLHDWMKKRDTVGTQLFFCKLLKSLSSICRVQWAPIQQEEGWRVLGKTISLYVMRVVFNLILPSLILEIVRKNCSDDYLSSWNISDLLLRLSVRGLHRFLTS